MALCLVHGAAGYLGYEVARRGGAARPGLLVAAVALANAPDFDFLPGLLLGQPGAYHRGVSHTLAAVVAVGIAVGLGVRWWCGPGRAAWRAGLWGGAVYGSHLVLDYVASDVTPPHGARLLWPFSDAYLLAPVTLFHEIVIDPSGRTAFLASLVTPAALRVWGRELALVVLLVASVRIARALWVGVETTGVEMADEP